MAKVYKVDENRLRNHIHYLKNSNKSVDLILNTFILCINIFVLITCFGMIYWLVFIFGLMAIISLTAWITYQLTAKHFKQKELDIIKNGGNDYLIEIGRIRNNDIIQRKIKNKRRTGRVVVL